MLRGLILENFKAFGGRRVIPIKPITLIFGPNSAGKSAIIQSLLLLKQSVRVDSKDESTLTFSGPLVDLGSYGNVQFNHEQHRSVEITPIFDTKIHDGFDEWLGDDQRIRGSRGIGVRITNSLTDELNIENTLYNGGTRITFPIYINDTSQTIGIIADWIIATQVFANRDHYFNQFFSKAETEHHIEWFRRTPLSFIPSWDHPLWQEILRGSATGSQERWDRFMNGLQEDGSELFRWKSISKFLSEVVDGLSALDKANVKERERFVGLRSLAHPFLRSPFLPSSQLDDLTKTSFPKSVRSAVARADETEFLDALRVVFRCGAPHGFPDTENLTILLSRFLSEWLSTVRYLGPLRAHPDRSARNLGTADYVGVRGEGAVQVLISSGSVARSINTMFERFGIQYRVVIPNTFYWSSRGVEHFNLELTDLRSGIRVGLQDVGFGLSQVIPILVQSQISRYETIVIEQPELHLHPRLQSELADVFLKSAKRNGNTFILETHSEHLLLRLMRRMRETAQKRRPRGFPKVMPSDVALIYVHPMEDGSGSIPIVIDLDDEGNLLTAWPNGFFEEGFNERFA